MIDLSYIIPDMKARNMKLADTTMESGFSFQQELLLQALKRQATTGMLMTNPRVTGFTSFAKAVLNFINDKKAPKTCKNLYNYLVKNGYYDKLETSCSFGDNVTVEVRKTYMKARKLCK
jgi:DNA polymerase III gamma/tau subunit